MREICGNQVCSVVLRPALRSRLLQPLALYNSGVSLFFMGRFGEAEQVLRNYLEALPDPTSPSYARVLMERARVLRRAAAVAPPEG